MEGYVGFFDMDSEYRECLMRQLMKREELTFTLVEFTKLDSILAFAHSRRLEMLLISDLALTEEVRSADIGRIILLTEEQSLPDSVGTGGSFIRIFKYQAASGIAEALMHQYIEATAGTATLQLYPFPLKKVDYGVFSPIKRCLKTSFSIALAQLMGAQQNTLLLCFEPYSALCQMMDVQEQPGKGDLSDAFYYYLQGSLSVHEADVIQSCHSFDFISPVQNPEALRELAPEELAGFVQYFIKEQHYGCLIIDFGDALIGVEQLFSCCSRIFMPVKTDWISEKKKDNYLDYIQRTQGSLMDRFELVHPPYQHIGSEGRGREKGHFARLISGDFYDYVRQCI